MAKTKVNRPKTSSKTKKAKSKSKKPDARKVAAVKSKKTVSSANRSKTTATKSGSKSKVKAKEIRPGTTKKASTRPAKASAPAKPQKGGVVGKRKSQEKEISRRVVARLRESGSVAAVSTATRKRTLKAKALTRNFLLELGQHIKTAVMVAIHAGKGREIVGTAPSGDATFEVDRIAEKALLTFLNNAKMPVAYYSEDAGYTTFTSAQPTNLLVVDPIDGSRAAKNGFEGCVVSICSTRVIERPTIADLDNACVTEIMGNRTFYAERGKGARIYVDGHIRKAKLSANENLETVSWSMTVPARPAELIFPTAARLIDLTSLKGGFFACNSTAFSLTRLVSGQLDACVDFANRFYRDIPTIVEDYFINAGRGVVLGICPYDFAAALLISQEAGCVVTDAYGKSFKDVLLLDSSVPNQRSLIAASNPQLHEKLMSFFDTRIDQLENLLRRRKTAKK